MITDRLSHLYHSQVLLNCKSPSVISYTGLKCIFDKALTNLMIKKKTFMLLFASALCLVTEGQTTLSSMANCAREGDSLVMRIISGAQPGVFGRDVVWDFSEKEKGRVHNLLYKLSGDTLSYERGGTSWRTTVNGDTLCLTGFENRHTLMEYDEPLPLLRYPFAYGDSIKGSFHGIGKWCDRLFLRVWGDGITRADATGTLILPPGDTLRHVLRVHSVRRTWQYDYDSIRTWDGLREVVRQEERRGIAPVAFGMEPDISETYAWYAPGWRYPVLRMENVTDGTVTFSLALIYPPESQLDLDYDMDNALVRLQMNIPGGSGSQEGGQDDSASAMTSHTTNYDSSTSTVSVSFTLSHAATVSLLLSDVAGVAWRSTEHTFDGGGTYSLSLCCSGLPRGQYALRITCGTDIIMDKFKVR